MFLHATKLTPNFKVNIYWLIVYNKQQHVLITIQAKVAFDFC